MAVFVRIVANELKSLITEEQENSVIHKDEIT